MFLEPYFELSYPTNVKPEIFSKKSNCKFDKTFFHKFNKSIEKVEQKKEKNKQLADFLHKFHVLLVSGDHHIFSVFGFFDDSGNANPKKSVGYIVIDEKEYDNPEKCCRMIETKKRSNWKERHFIEKKYNKIICAMVPNELYPSKLADKSFCEKSSFLKNLRLNLLYKLFDSLEKGGDVLLGHIYNICDCDIIEFFYLCSILFEKVIIMYYDEFYIYGTNFLHNNAMTKEEFKKKVYSPFMIEPKIKYDEMISFLMKTAKKRIFYDQLLLDQQYDEYLYLNVIDNMKKSKYFKLSKEDKNMKSMENIKNTLTNILSTVYVKDKLSQNESKKIEDEDL